jgi:hypothetical protein
MQYVKVFHKPVPKVVIGQWVNNDCPVPVVLDVIGREVVIICDIIVVIVLLLQLSSTFNAFPLQFFILSCLLVFLCSLLPNDVYSSSDKRCSAKGAYVLASSRSFNPMAPLQSLSNPSASRRRLWSAQQVYHTLSAASGPSNLMPVFSTRHLSFRIPKTHSASFQNDSIQLLRQTSVRIIACFAGAWVQDHLW